MGLIQISEWDENRFCPHFVLLTDRWHFSLFRPTTTKTLCEGERRDEFIRPGEKEMIFCLIHRRHLRGVMLLLQILFMSCFVSFLSGLSVHQTLLTHEQTPQNLQFLLKVSIKCHGADVRVCLCKVMLMQVLPLICRLRLKCLSWTG